MHATTAGPTPPAPPRRDVRGRILAAATPLFYGEGIRAVSADKVIVAAGVSKVTFYRHFSTKDALVVAYLEGNAELERGELERLADQHASDPEAALTALASAIGELARKPEFRGCSFVNAAAEYADPDHPVRRAVADHRDWYLGLFADIAGRAGARDAHATATQLMMLRDGAMVCGDVGEAATVGDRLSAGFAAVLAGAVARET